MSLSDVSFGVSADDNTFYEGRIKCKQINCMCAKMEEEFCCKLPTYNSYHDFCYPTFITLCNQARP